MASHDVGYARDVTGRMMFHVPELLLWGRGYRLDELRAAVLRVQLKKLPATVAAMRRSKYRVRAALEKYPAVRLRRILDPAGDTGAFLIVTFADPATAGRVNEALRAEGIVTFPQGVSNILMTSWGLHLYYNNPSLVGKTSVDGRGFPWSLPQNAGSETDYSKGVCPVADSLFERSLLLAVPSCLTERDEEDVVTAFDKVLGALL
jgi:dTDP-4-amino-4,6-dideoxygalactose transaminase